MNTESNRGLPFTTRPSRGRNILWIVCTVLNAWLLLYFLGEPITFRRLREVARWLALGPADAPRRVVV